jgi:hypothetical protein
MTTISIVSAVLLTVCFSCGLFYKLNKRGNFEDISLARKIAGFLLMLFIISFVFIPVAFIPSVGFQMLLISLLIIAFILLFIWKPLLIWLPWP